MTTSSLTSGVVLRCIVVVAAGDEGLAVSRNGLVLFPGDPGPTAEVGDDVLGIFDQKIDAADGILELCWRISIMYSSHWLLFLCWLPKQYCLRIQLYMHWISLEAGVSSIRIPKISTASELKIGYLFSSS